MSSPAPPATPPSATPPGATPPGATQPGAERPNRARARAPRATGPAAPPSPASPLAADALPPPALPPPLTATATFEGTAALVRLSRAVEVSAVALDGHSLPQHRWRAAGEAMLRINCPPPAFNGLAHALTLSFAEGAGVEPVTLSFASRYHFALERLDDDGLAGWIYDELRPASSLTLEVEGETWPAIQHTATGMHPGLAERSGVVGGGFDIELPPRPAMAQPELVTITVRGTLFQPFGPILRGGGLAGAVVTAAAAARALGRGAAGALASAMLLPALLDALGHRPAPPPPHSDTRLLRGAGRTRRAPPMVDVVVPVYRGQAETLACLASVLADGSGIAHRVTVIDDCSPEPELSAALQALAAAGRIRYLRNERNLGFVATANRGLALDGEADVLLLNSDTVTPPGLLDRLYRAAASDPAIATVTPLSNNATICSLPLPPGDPADPWGRDVAAMDALCRELNAGVVRDIPTAHGFCMFIRRAALDDLGAFDVATFGAGYGEENDFALRALERGWRNVCAADVYVRHVGAVSFAGARAAQVAENLGKLEARYPYYADLVADFLRTDPLHDLRNRVQKAVWRQSGLRIVLIVTLSLGGGAVRHAEDVMRRLAAEGCLPLALAMDRDGDGRPMVVLRRWGSGELLRYPHPAPVTEALADILDLAPRFIHVQHLLDLPDGVAEFVRDCGIPYAVTLHDFFYGCPRVTLLDEGGAYCGLPPVSKCAVCLRHGPIHPDIHPSLADSAHSGEAWRGRWDGLLREAAEVIAPSRDTAERYAAMFPGLHCEIRPHFTTTAIVPHPHAPTGGGGRLRVAVPGAIGPQKGVRQLVELARHCARWEDDLLFVVVGHTDRDKELETHENIRVTGRFPPDQAVGALTRARCRVALFLSVFPETWCYTLSESLEAGLVPVAYEFGAIGERLRALGVGVLVPPHAPPERIAAAIREAADKEVPALPPTAIWGQYDRLLADYYTPVLTDLADSMPPPDMPRLLTWPAGLHRDRWCGGRITLHLWSPRPITRVAVTFWLPKPGAGQAVEIAWQGRALARAPLDEGRNRRVCADLPDQGVRFLDLACRFDFLIPLAPPDLRACAAMFSGVEISEGGGWSAVDMPGAPGRH